MLSHLSILLIEFDFIYFFDEVTSTARRKSKIKSQKSKVLWNGLFRDFKWLLYLRRSVLVMVIGLTTSPEFRSLPLCLYVKHYASILQASILSIVASLVQ